MNKLMFVIFDNKADLYSSPFFSVRRESALRDLLRATNDPQSEISSAPADYDLYLIGAYDDETGTVVAYPQHEFITNAYVLKLQHEGEQK